MYPGISLFSSKEEPFPRGNSELKNCRGQKRHTAEVLKQTAQKGVLQKAAAGTSSRTEVPCSGRFSRSPRAAPGASRSNSLYLPICPPNFCGSKNSVMDLSRAVDFQFAQLFTCCQDNVTTSKLLTRWTENTEQFERGVEEKTVWLKRGKFFRSEIAQFHK